MKEFLFKLFRLEWEKEECSSCDRLMLLLEEEKRLNKRLLDELLVKPEIKVEDKVEFEPIVNHTSWSAQRAKLEREDKIKADEIRRKNSIQVLEEELLDAKEPA